MELFVLEGWTPRVAVVDVGIEAALGWGGGGDGVGSVRGRSVAGVAVGVGRRHEGGNDREDHDDGHGCEEADGEFAG